MNNFCALLLAVLLVSCSSFTVRVPSGTFSRHGSLSMSTPEPTNTEEETEGLDLDLGEMFEMFDAADGDADFDDAMKKVKGDK